jgi:hypothetical protein
MNADASNKAFDEPPALDELRLLARRRAVYRPRHAARDLGVPHDAIDRLLRLRRSAFPASPPELKRRREWNSSDDYIQVLFVACSLNSRLAQVAHFRILKLREKEVRENCVGSASIETRAKRAA